MASGGSRMLRQIAAATALAVAVAGGAAYLYTARMPDAYRGRALLLLSHMKLMQRNEVPAVFDGGGAPARRINFLEVQQLDPLPMPDYRLLLTSEAMAVELAERLGEISREAGKDADGIPPQRVLGALEVRDRLLQQTAQKVEYQQVLELYFTWSDPELAAKGANAWADLAVDMARRMRTAAREGAVEYLEGQTARVRGALDEALAGIERIDAASNPAGLEARLEALEAARTQHLLRQSMLNAEIARAEAETALLEQAPPADVQELALRRVDLAGARAEREAAGREAAALEPQTAALRTELARVRRERAVFEVQVAALQEQADEFQVTLESIKLAAGDEAPEFKVVSQAIAPAPRVGPHRDAMIVAALLLAAIGAPACLFALYALRRYAQSLEAGAAA